MLSHPLVLQLRFTRSEFRRALEGLSDTEARQRFMPNELPQLEYWTFGLARTAILSVLRAKSTGIGPT